MTPPATRPAAPAEPILSDARRAVAEVLRDPLLGAVCFAILTLPIEVSGRLFPTTLINLSRLGMGAAIAIVVLRAIRGTPLVAPSRWLIAGVAAVATVDIASVLATRWPDGGRELVAIAFYAAFAFTLVQALTDRRRLVIAGSCLLVAAGAEALLLLGEQIGGFYVSQIRDMAGRRNGTFIDPNVTARFLVVGGVVLFGSVRDVVGLRARIALPLAALLAAAVVLTGSRTGWILLGLLVVVAVALAWRERATRLVGLAVVAGFLVAFVAVPSARQRAADTVDALPGPRAAMAEAVGSGPPVGGWVTLASVRAAPPRAVPTDAEPSTSTPIDGLLERLPLDPIRSYLLRAAVAMFVDHPLAGVGLGGFEPMFVGPYAGFVPPAYRDRQVFLAHTDIARIAAETGLLGLAAFAIFAVGIVVAVRRALAGGSGFDRVALAAAVLAMAVVFVAAQTEGRFYADPYLWVAIGVVGVVGYHRAIPPGHSRREVAPSDPTSLPHA